MKEISNFFAKQGLVTKLEDDEGVWGGSQRHDPACVWGRPHTCHAHPNRLQAGLCLPGGDMPTCSNKQLPLAPQLVPGLPGRAETRGLEGLGPDSRPCCLHPSALPTASGGRGSKAHRRGYPLVLSGKFHPQWAERRAGFRETLLEASGLSTYHAPNVPGPSASGITCPRKQSWQAEASPCLLLPGDTSGTALLPPPPAAGDPPLLTWLPHQHSAPCLSGRLTESREPVLLGLQVAGWIPPPVLSRHQARGDRQGWRHNAHLYQFNRRADRCYQGTKRRSW